MRRAAPPASVETAAVQMGEERQHVLLGAAPNQLAGEMHNINTTLSIHRSDAASARQG